jgi:hypothetical protein
MKKILNEWNKYLNEFKMPDALPADSMISAKQAQAQIQKEIDKNSKFHASGREINPVFLQGTLNEADAVQLMNSSPDIKELKKALKGLIYFDGEKIDLGLDGFERIDNNVRIDESQMKELENIAIELKHNLEIFYQFATMLENSLFYKTLKSIALFTGHSVDTVRNPDSFDPTRIEDDIGVFGRSRHNNFFTENEESPYFSVDFLSDMISEDQIDYFTLFETFFSVEFYNFDSYESDDMKTIVSILEDDTLKSKFKKIMEIGNPQITAEDYKTANNILIQLAQLPHNKEQYPYTIFRGMRLPLQSVSSIKESLKGGEQIEFNFHTISSWSARFEVAEGFIKDYSNKGGEIVPTIFKAYGPTRGTYLNDISLHSSEQEFITGGNLKVKSIEWDDHLKIWFMMCKFD